MTFDFSQPIVTNPSGQPADYLGVNPVDSTWYRIAAYDLALDVDLDTGWSLIEVNDEGILRADVEGGVPSPVPVIRLDSTLSVIWLGVYPDGSVVSESDDPDSLPLGDVGRIPMNISESGGRIISVTVGTLLEDRGPV